VALSGKSQSTLNNYARCLAHMVYHFDGDLLALDEEQVLDYLHLLLSSSETPSESYFKHTVYGLRYLYKQYGLKALHVALPSIPHDKSLPEVLSQQEVRRLLKTPKLLKHRIVLALLYGCGLRNNELCNLRIKEVDLDRQMLHVCRGKGRKDRYVPLGPLLIRGISTYLQAEQPHEYLINSNKGSGQYTARGVQWVLRQAGKESGIGKAVTAHTLRHSYATHLLEMGMDIMTLKDLLGHESVMTTMTYLHVARVGRQLPFSPLDKLYEPSGS
jgi:site-specific recombinase XerD